MYKILIISRSSPSTWEQMGILSRKDFEVKYESDFEMGFQKLVRENYDLFIAEEWPYDSAFLSFYSAVISQIKVPNLKGIFICSTSMDIKKHSAISEILRTPLNPEKFNDAVASALNLKKRSSKRYIVRMHLGLRDDSSGLLRTCITINMNKGGMLIETTKSLPIGKSFWWTFQGVLELEGLTIKGTIVNESPRESFSLNYRYGVKFDESCKDAIKKIEEFLKEKF